MKEIEIINGQKWFRLRNSQYAPNKYAPVSLRDSLLKQAIKRFAALPYGKRLLLRDICGEEYWSGIKLKHIKHLAGAVFIELVEDGLVPYVLHSRRDARPLVYRRKLHL